MDKIAKETLNKRLTIPFIVALIGVLAIVIGMFLPYMSATGELAEYIDAYPDIIEIEELDLTASDLRDIPMVSIGKIATFAYTEAEGVIFNTVLSVFCVLLALCTLFVILKKPIAVMVFSVLTYGVYAFHNFATREDFFGAEQYTWGNGYYIIMVACAVVLAGAVWMLVKKILAKKELADPQPMAE